MPEQSTGLHTISTDHESAIEQPPDIPVAQLHPPSIEPWLPSAPHDLSSRSRRRLVTQQGESPGKQPNRIWVSRGLWPGSLAVAISLAFTLLLTQDEPARTRAWLGLIAAGVLAILAWGGQPWPNPFVRPASVWPLERITPERALRLAGIGISIILIWSANSQFTTHQYDTFGLAGWLWLASMALLLASVAGWPLPGQHLLRKSALNQTQNSKLKTMPSNEVKGQNSLPSPAPDTLAAIEQSSVPLDVTLPYDSAALVAAHDQTQNSKLKTQNSSDEQPPWSRWEVALFLGIVALSVALRVWDLTRFPYAIEGDEIMTGRVASQAYINGNNPSIFTTLWDFIDLPALWFLGVAQSLKVGGITLAALRLPAALFGAATVIPLYFLLRSVWGRAAAIAGAAFMAFGVVDIAFSRTTVNNIVTPFFWTVCFFFLLRALRRGRPIDWLLAGLAGGLSEHFYYGTHLLPFILIGFALYLLVIHWQRARYFILSFGLVALGYMAAFGPLLSTYMLRPNLYFGRGQGVLTWNHIPTSLEDLATMWNTLWPLFAQNLLTVSAQGGTDVFYAGPLMLPVEAALLVLGVALLIWRWRHPASFLLLLSGLSVLIVGATLIPIPGNLNHWTSAFPAFYAALALPVAGMAWAAGRFLPRRLQCRAGALLAVALVLMGLANINYYFNQYHASRPERDLRASKVRFVADIGTGYILRGVGRTWQPYEVEATGYLIKGADGGQIWNPASELPVASVEGKGLAFTFFPDEAQYLNPVMLMYPGGTRGQINSLAGALMFDYYLVSPEVVSSAYGATLQIFERDSKTLRTTSKVERIGEIAPGATYPLVARWTALVYLPSSFAYNLSVQGAQASLIFDGQASPPWQDRAVQPGWHQVTVQATLTAPAPLKLMLQEKDADNLEVSAERLFPTVPGSGLLGSVPMEDKSAALLVRTDPFIGFSDLLSRQWPGPSIGAGSLFRVRWAGELHASMEGTYQFEVRTNGVARLLVDGNTLVRACPVNDPAPVAASISLTTGWHAIQLDYQAIGNAHTLELYWVTPAGERSLVPPAALRFAPETQLGASQPPEPPENVVCIAP